MISTRWVRGGGSSSVLRRACAVGSVIRSASSRMNTLRLASWGASAAVRSSSRTCSIRIIGAPFGLSRGGVGTTRWQSGYWPAATRRQIPHVPHPWAAQTAAWANATAVSRRPTPDGPTKA